MKFKVGDRVKFVKSIYGHSSDVKVGEIYKIKTVDTTDIPYQIENLEWFMEEELESVEYTYEDLKKTPIGTKIKFENGETLLKDGASLFKSDGYVRTIEELKKFETRLLGKIVKIEEPEYTTVYEYKPEILDEAEKRYLKGVIRPFRDDVEVIRKLFSRTKGEYYIQIRYKDEPSTNLPYFESQEMYKNMETEKIYTLEELGL